MKKEYNVFVAKYIRIEFIAQFLFVIKLVLSPLFQNTTIRQQNLFLIYTIVLVSWKKKKI